MYAEMFQNTRDKLNQTFQTSKHYFILLSNSQYLITVTLDSSFMFRVIKDEHRHLKSVYSLFFCTETKKKHVLILWNK